MMMAQVVSLLISVPLALFSAYRANSRADKAITAGAFGLISLPGFALAVFLVYLFSIQLGWFPAIGYDRITGPDGLGANLKSVALPVAVLAAGLTAVYTRVLRSDLIATLQEDFVLMARSKGLPDLAHPAAPRPAPVVVLAAHACSASTSGRSSAAR